jgi:hypothetical protein
MGAGWAPELRPSYPNVVPFNDHKKRCGKEFAANGFILYHDQTAGSNRTPDQEGTDYV